VTKPIAALRREVDAAFKRGDDRGGVQILGQIVAIAPDRSVTWPRLARNLRQLRPSDYSEKNLLLERAAAAAYIAYQRSGNSAEEAESLVVIARTYADRMLWRPALDTLRVSLETREVAEVRHPHRNLRLQQVASVLFRRDAKVLRRLRKDRALFVDRLGELRWPARVGNLGSRDKAVLDERIGVHHRPNVRGNALA
jgi:hypothetical protein